MITALIKNKLLLFLIVFLPSLLFPESQIRFTHLSTPDGLTSTAVTCIFQDQQGFMWFGTQDGLNKDDAYSFQTFMNDPQNQNSLIENMFVPQLKLGRSSW
jgi:ligand-binding sensor domain-containing protein